MHALHLFLLCGLFLAASNATSAPGYFPIAPPLPQHHHNSLLIGNREAVTGRHSRRNPNTATAPSFKAGTFTLKEQSDGAVCSSRGEAQWSGTIDVSDSRRLFFWAANSRNDPENDPIIFWLNGGPGGSSMLGLFAEMGPCWLEVAAPGQNATTSSNHWAWNNNATVVFLDQPAGVGLSSLASDAAPPGHDADGAEDFQVFLNIFFRDVFPSKAHLPIHIAAESYGGHYAPTYVQHILQSKRYASTASFRGNISSLILVNAVLDQTAPALGAYELLCLQERGQGIVNATACEQMKIHVPKCEELGRHCRLTNDGHICEAMIDFCYDNIHVHFAEKVAAGRTSSFNIHQACHDPPMCTSPTQGNISAYLNNPKIKQALGLDSEFTYHDINTVINKLYISNKDAWITTTGAVSFILDAHKSPAVVGGGTARHTQPGNSNSLGDIRVLVLNGNEDYAVNTPGNKWLYDGLPWSGQAEFRAAKWRPLEGMGADGEWKATRDGRLAFVAVDGAGHTVPADKREGAYRIVQKWLDGGWRM